MMENIKALKVKLGAWYKDVFGKVEENKKSTFDKVAYWDNLESQRPLSTVELEERLLAMEDFKKWSLMEETSWLKGEGDRIMGFFLREWVTPIGGETALTGFE